MFENTMKKCPTKSLTIKQSAHQETQIKTEHYNDATNNH